MCFFSLYLILTYLTLLYKRMFSHLSLLLPSPNQEVCVNGVQ